jgi:GalNAc-alpha-(1->4)-GalNAc-alpha-(1->3)-diNAcBac-PP-undecaprenol alpha-1,4-N-acetyl-D-galactosaminyltransferase
MRKICIVVASLGYGGAERVAATMASHWATHGVRPTLVTMSGDAPDRYPLHAEVARTRLPRLGRSLRVITAVRLLRKAIARAKPDAVLAFVEETNVLVLLATIGMSVPVIVATRTDPTRYVPIATFRGLRRMLYPRAAAVVAQTERAAAWFRKELRLRRVHVIPNPVSSIRRERRSAQRSTVIAVGRLTAEKGHADLVAAFSRIADGNPSWDLVIVGEGPLRMTLGTQIERAGLAHRVALPGSVDDVADRLAAADLFVLPSSFEGFPNALLEAMSAGLACISYDCASGPRELLRGGADGVLVPVGDVTQLAEAMDALMRDPSRRARLGEAASEVQTRYSIEKIMEMWDTLIAQTLPRT